MKEIKEAKVSILDQKPQKRIYKYDGYLYNIKKPEGCPAKCNYCYKCPIEPDCNYDKIC